LEDWLTLCLEPTIKLSNSLRAKSDSRNSQRLRGGRIKKKKETQRGSAIHWAEPQHPHPYPAQRTAQAFVSGCPHISERKHRKPRKSPTAGILRFFPTNNRRDRKSPNPNTPVSPCQPDATPSFGPPPRPRPPLRSHRRRFAHRMFSNFFRFINDLVEIESFGLFDVWIF